MVFLNNRRLKVLFLFVCTYALLYALGSLTPLQDWDFRGSPFQADWLSFLLPIPAFFLMYLLVEWLDKYFKSDVGHSVWVPALLFGLGLLAWYVVLFWYNKNVYELAGQATVQFDYFGKLFDSHYPEFLLAAFGGWVTRAVVDRK